VIAFRALTRADYPLLQRWLSLPHIDRFWNQRLDRAGLEAKYGPRIDGSVPTPVWVIELDGQPVGWIQWYRWSEYSGHAAQISAGPGTAGVDLAIGEQELIGRGLGPRVIAEFLQKQVFVERDICGVVTDIDANNTRSLRAFVKVGFSHWGTVRLPGETVTRQVLRLERSR
jgi:RimJ/RimL family protein N-acetyltransferase